MMSENFVELCLEIIWKTKFIHYELEYLLILNKWLKAHLSFLLLLLGLHVFCFV